MLHAPEAETEPGVGRECPACGRMNAYDARFCAGCGARFGGDGPEGGADPLLGRTIADRYRIDRLLGRGGMGVVYRVEHTRIGKLMAMKLLHGALAREKDLVKRFKREAEAVSKLDHPNTVQVFDFGQSEGMMYLVMEYLSGRDLGVVLQEEGPLPFDRVARIAVQVCASVAQAHERGIIHRDLKPENVMLLATPDAPDFVKVLDFGLAKLRDAEELGERSITRAGAIVGTPYYMAPEHIRGERVDARSDVYAVGALLYKLVTGVPPFWAATPMGVLTQHLTEPLVSPSERSGLDLPPEADAIIERSLEKEPGNRYASMDALRDALLDYLEGAGEADGLEPTRAPRPTAANRSRSGRDREVATRGDIDRYERRIRRRSLLGRAFAGLTLLAAVGAGIWAFQNRSTPPTTTETEPNDTIAQANHLPEGVAFTGYLGQRLDERQGDVDVYRIELPDDARHVVRIELSAIPNMDITFEIFRRGITEPLLTAESGSTGHPEIVPNFPLQGRVHYLRVREVSVAGQWPIENVSDPYTIVWRRVRPAEDEEREINDTFELANPIALDEVRRGYIGWGGDRDYHCIDAEVDAVDVDLEPIPALDLVLTIDERDRGAERTVDVGGTGEGESVRRLGPTRPGRTCLVVSAKRPKVGVGNDPDVTYSLRVTRSAP